MPPDLPIQHYMKYGPGNELSAYWLDAYGWIACYFAQLEGLSYSIIELLALPHELDGGLRLRYSKRTDLARRLVRTHFERAGNAGLAREWDEFMKEAKAAAYLRNDILHNPMTVNLVGQWDMTDEAQGIQLVKKEGKPVLKLGEVQAYARAVTALNSRMLSLVQRSAFGSTDTHRPNGAA